MIEKALHGSGRYWSWIIGLLIVIGAAFGAYLYQFNEGLAVTGLSRDVSWGLYIAQLTFLVGVAASAVMVVLPYYLHNSKEFGRITILGEFLAVTAIIMCMLSVVVDLGKPQRLVNIMLHPSPKSIMFYDVMVLQGYMIINIFVGWVVLAAEKKQVKPPEWIKPFIYLSIPWAISIHTVTAFLYAGLPGRHLWLTAILAGRFLSSAFAAGPALLILLALIIKKFTRFDPGDEAIGKLSIIVLYALFINVFFVGLEFFTAFYSGIPSHQESLKYLFVGLEGHHALTPFMWASSLGSLGAIVVMLFPANRRNHTVLAITCFAIFVSLWIDKGLCLVAGGFIPNPLEHVNEYFPTGVEILITIGIWSLGALMLTVFYKVAIAVKEETGGGLAPH
ncbi:MAG: polysulfide reductase NrfD [Deltaproteobacteria bacterium]|nr:polysulfide reductase NrfD [Deltaproteobacteria bacterium]